MNGMIKGNIYKGSVMNMMMKENICEEGLFNVLCNAYNRGRGNDCFKREITPSTHQPTHI